jgi:hypothetical protein
MAAVNDGVNVAAGMGGPFVAMEMACPRGDGFPPNLNSQLCVENNKMKIF